LRKTPRASIGQTFINKVFYSLFGEPVSTPAKTSKPIYTLELPRYYK